MSDQLLREVDEEIRREQLKKLWDRYGIFVVGAAVLIVGATAGFRGWEAWQARQSADAGDKFLAAIEAAQDDRFADAQSTLGELESSGVGDYTILAQLRVAGLSAERGDREGAISEFEAMAADNGVDQTLRDLATLRAAQLSIESTDYDTLKAQVEPFAASDGVWRHFAREILGLSAYRAGNEDAARTWFEALTADPQAPQNARGRAELVLSVIGGSDGAAAADDNQTETQ